MTLASFIIPAFRERRNIENLLKSFDNIKAQDVSILIVNGNPEDDTSELIASCPDKRVKELRGHNDLFWSGLVNIGLSYVREPRNASRIVVIMNADITFGNDILARYLAIAEPDKPCQIAALTVANGIVVSSGVRVISWSLTINRHPYAGMPVSALEGGVLIPVTYLPTRCLFLPMNAIDSVGNINEKALPHYGADHEFSARLTRRGVNAYIATDIVVCLNKDSTGDDVYVKEISLLDRLRQVNSIKSPSNPIINMVFVFLVYPWYAIPSATVLYVLRSALEIVLGGNALKRIFRYAESGFSGK